MGEYTGSLVFLVEHAPEGRRGLLGALGASRRHSRYSARLGRRCSFCGQHVNRGARRLGLAHSIPAGPGCRNSRLHPSPVRARNGCRGEACTPSDSRDTSRSLARAVAGFAGLSVYSAVSFYIGFVYLVSWLQTADGIPPSRSLEINSLSMVILLPVVIAAGWLSDRIGRKPLMVLASLGGLVGAVPIFWLLNHPSALLAQIGQLGLVLLMGVYYGPLPAILVEAAPPAVRCTAVALGYNLCYALFGGLLPLWRLGWCNVKATK